MNKLVLLFFVCACLFVYDIECKGGRGGHGRSGGRGGYGSGHSSWSSSSSSRHTYPSSHNGLSGSGGSHLYPTHTGMSGGYGSSRSHSYPSNNGLSGYGSGSSGRYGSTWTDTRTNRKPTYDSGSGRSSHRYNIGHNAYGQGYGYVPYTYHSAPQTVYIHQYRNTDSQYSDLLTGLALYNLGRSHSHHYHHYYEDDFYRGRYSLGTYQRPYDAPDEKANCYLRISEEGKEQKLTIPCEIVSTFTNESEKVQMNTTTVVCKNVTASVKNASLVDNTKSNLNKNDLDSILNSILSDSQRADQMIHDMELGLGVHSTIRPIAPMSSTTETTTLLNSLFSTSATQPAPENNVTLSPSNATGSVINVMKDKENLTLITQTICTNVTSIDPLKQKGQKLILTSKIKCTVEIETSTSLLRHPIDCKTLEAYSKMPEPKKENSLTPSRNTLKSWMSSPPWWLSLFIAV